MELFMQCEEFAKKDASTMLEAWFAAGPCPSKLLGKIGLGLCMFRDPLVD